MMVAVRRAHFFGEHDLPERYRRGDIEAVMDIHRTLDYWLSFFQLDENVRLFFGGI